MNMRGIQNLGIIKFGEKTNKYLEILYFPGIFFIFYYII
jgi:hypothetical protein